AADGAEHRRPARLQDPHGARGASRCSGGASRLAGVRRMLLHDGGGARPLGRSRYLLASRRGYLRVGGVGGRVTFLVRTVATKSSATLSTAFSTTACCPW